MLIGINSGTKPSRFCMLHFAAMNAPCLGIPPLLK
jgi:hypothetical protein